MESPATHPAVEEVWGAMLSSTEARWFLFKSVGWVSLQALEIMGRSALT